MTDEKVYEVKKTVTLTKHMQLIDLNGLRVNFQSDCTPTTKPDQRFQACIVTQDQLDEGKVNFEDSEHGKYARRVIYQKNTPLNHFAAIRLPKDAEVTTEIECSVVVRLKDIPTVVMEEVEEQMPPPFNDKNKKKVTFVDDPDDTRVQMQQQLQALSDDPSYRDSDRRKDVDLDPLTKVDDDLVSPPSSSRPWNIWIWIGILCFLLCAILWWRQSRHQEIVPQLE